MGLILPFGVDMLSSMWALWLSVAARTLKAVWSWVLAGMIPIWFSASEAPWTAYSLQTHFVCVIQDISRVYAHFKTWTKNYAIINVKKVCFKTKLIRKNNKLHNKHVLMQSPPGDIIKDAAIVWENFIQYTAIMVKVRSTLKALAKTLNGLGEESTDPQE